MARHPSPMPWLYLWGDLLGEGPRARLLRKLLPGLLSRLPGLEARRFWPVPGEEAREGRAFPLTSGARTWEVRTLANEAELKAIRRAVEGTVPAGSPVLALAEEGEDPTQRILADIPTAGEVLCWDPGEPETDGALLARRIAAQLHSEAPALDLVLTAPVLGPSGYAAEGRSLFLALEARRDLRVCLRPLRFGGESCEEDRDFMIQVKEASQRSPSGAYVAVHLVFPPQFKPDPSARANVLRTMYETDRVPESWIPSMREADEIWVPSAFNLKTFRRAGLPSGKIRVLPPSLIPGHFSPEAPPGDRSRRVPGFLALFDWSERKAPDLCLRSFGRCFSRGEARLILKAHASQGEARGSLRSRARGLLEEGASEAGHPPPEMEWVEEMPAPSRMAELYRRADVLLLPSRGEGWGRPVHEAMSLGMPVLCTRYGGVQDLCAGRSTCFDVPGRLVPCPPRAVEENPLVRGHRWFEPDPSVFERSLRSIASDLAAARQRGARARRHVLRHFPPSLQAERAARGVRELLEGAPALRVGPSPQKRPPRLHLQGPIFEASSYGCITRNLSRALCRLGGLELRLIPLAEAQRDPLEDPDLLPLLGKGEGRPDFWLRSGWPPSPGIPDAGFWIQRFDWEYGAPPREAASLLSHGPDEIWVHSRFVEEGLLAAGIPGDRLWRIPHGVDPGNFRPEREPLPRIREAARGGRVFLFVGGPIWRKGADLLIQAWLQTFRREDPVLLVARFAGSERSYAGQGVAGVYRKASLHPEAPRILLLEEDLSDSEMGRLYASADALVHPFRGEGFGLPILEAMASGLPVLTTEGGAPADFVDPETAVLVPATWREVEIDEDCLGRPGVLDPDPGALQEGLRRILEEGAGLRERAKALSQTVRSEHSWDRVAARVRSHLFERFQELR